MAIYYVAGIPYSSNDIYHHGIKGQQWGNRKYQNEDGSLTPAGKTRYGQGDAIGEDEDKRKGMSQIQAMYGQLKDSETRKELDYYISKVKAGTMSSEEAVKAAQEAVELDHARVEYRAKQKEKERKKAENEQKKKQKEAEKAAKLAEKAAQEAAKKAEEEAKKKKKQNRGIGILKTDNSLSSYKDEEYDPEKDKTQEAIDAVTVGNNRKKRNPTYVGQKYVYRLFS